MTTTVLAPEDVDSPNEHAGVDPEAPYGRNAEGVPYKRSREWREKLAAGLAAGRQTQSARAAAKKTTRRASSSAPRTTPKTSAKAGGVQDYRPGIAAGVSLIAGLLAAAGQLNPTMTLNSVTVSLHAPQIVETVQHLAERHDWVQDVLEKAMTVGPYAEALATFAPLGMQLLANHRIVPVVPELGILSPEQLMAAWQASKPGGGSGDG